MIAQFFMDIKIKNNIIYLIFNVSLIYAQFCIQKILSSNYHIKNGPYDLTQSSFIKRFYTLYLLINL